MPLLRVAERDGLPRLLADHVHLRNNHAGAHADAKAMRLTGAMCVGADSIDDADRLAPAPWPRATS
ncbi:hypothetical protein [Streptomyces lydicus]|uniref:hypothetical protein n=1 Tax=Streptomyces lydicus TaxID=47763 RepID=UPI0037B3DACB